MQKCNLDVEAISMVADAVRNNDDLSTVRGFKTLADRVITSIDQLGATNEAFEQRMHWAHREPIWVFAGHLAQKKITTNGHAFSIVRRFRNSMRRFKAGNETAEDVRHLIAAADFLSVSELFIRDAA